MVLMSYDNQRYDSHAKKSSSRGVRKYNQKEIVSVSALFESRLHVSYLDIRSLDDPFFLP
jgi:hypothetical protein